MELEHQFEVLAFPVHHDLLHQSLEQAAPLLGVQASPQPGQVPGGSLGLLDPQLVAREILPSLLRLLQFLGDVLELLLPLA